MIRHPRIGQLVLCWYADRTMPLHSYYARVACVGQGPGPRNVGLYVGTQFYVVPRGNLRLPQIKETS